MDRYVLAGGLLVSGKGKVRANLVIEHGKVTGWISVPETSELPVFHVQDHLILPGLIDAHTHFHMASGDLFTVDDFAVGGKLAAAAGVTSVIDFIEPSPAQGLLEAIEERFRDVRDCPVDYQFHLVIPHRLAREEDWYQLMERYGLAALKGFTTYQEDGLALDKQDVAALLAWSGKNSGLLTVHAEDEQGLKKTAADLLAQGKTDMRNFPRSRPAGSEQTAVANILQLLEQYSFDDGSIDRRTVASRIMNTGNPPGSANLYFVHISSALALQTISEFRARSLRSVPWVETCPQFLVLDQSLYMEEMEPELYTVCPPLRTRSDREALWQGIRAGDVDVIASDHCAFTVEMKASPSWTSVRAGLPAVDAILPVLVNVGIREKRVEWEDIVRVTAENPARIFRLQSKGSLSPGSDADFVVIDENKLDGYVAPPLYSKAGYTPFLPEHLNRSWLRHVTRRGEFLLYDRKPAELMGKGQLISLS
ncbi:dihydroorotase [Paradesulfitobacterium ferrireducens]|uniref:dihydroorotase n=1 Tax=Paradesulfitobacterium ferrireducens TaxID=2816476 RepID=UPI001A8F0DBB|nr:amidohydrolase family protein [Paradesulfitobacterium ferrireducens]